MNLICFVFRAPQFIPESDLFSVSETVSEQIYRCVSVESFKCFRTSKHIRNSERLCFRNSEQI